MYGMKPNYTKTIVAKSGATWPIIDKQQRKRKAEQEAQASGIEKKKKVEDTKVKEIKMAQKKGDANRHTEEIAQSNATIQHTLNTLCGKIDEMKTDFNGRIDRLEDGLVERIKSVVKDEVASVKVQIDARVDSIQTELERVKKELADLENQGSGDKLKLNVVIAGLKQTEDENIVDKVNTVIKEGVGQDIKVQSATRKTSKQEGKDGVVIATFSTADDKEKVMDKKSSLAKSAQYKHVSIFHDRPYDQRMARANMKALVDTLGKDKLTMKGDRVLKNQKKAS